MRYMLSIIVLCCSIASLGAMKARERTDMVVIHHSETDQGNVESFRRHHVEVNKWDDIGYHYVVCNGKGGLDGEVQVGRAENLQGAHAGNPKPGRNSTSVGICLVGKSDFTEKQIEALITKATELCKKYDIEPSSKTIQRHHAECPGDSLDVDALIVKVRARLSESAR